MTYLVTDLRCHTGERLHECPRWLECIKAGPSSVGKLDKTLRQQPCVVSGRMPVTLHHLRGGSVVQTPWGSSGGGKKQNEALKLPLHVDYHVGRFGIDCRINGGVKSWESLFGRQIDLLNQVSSNLNLCLWGLAWKWTTQKERELIERKCRP